MDVEVFVAFEISRALGEELRAATEKKLQLVEEGFKIYREYVQEGTAAKTEKKVVMMI